MDCSFDRRQRGDYDYGLSRQKWGTCHADHQDRLIEWERAQGRRRELKVSHSYTPKFVKNTVPGICRELHACGNSRTELQMCMPYPTVYSCIGPPIAFASTLLIDRGPSHRGRNRACYEATTWR